jgi:hypothetical protein
VAVHGDSMTASIAAQLHQSGGGGKRVARRGGAASGAVAAAKPWA